MSYPRFCAAAALTIVSSAAVAQSSNTTVDLPPTVVTSAPDRSTPTTPDVHEAARRIDFTPGAVDIVPAEQYLIGRSLNLHDALEWTPGVVAQSRFGSDETRLSIRGSGLQRTFHLRGIELLQDGIPINQTDGSADFQSLEILAAQYIEVYRGGNALRYGSSTLGGAINFVSHTGLTASPAQARFEYGSYDYMRGQLSSGMAVGPLDYYVSGSEFFSGGFRDHSEQNSQRVFANVGYQISDNVETRLYLTGVNYKSELPGNVTKAQMESNPRLANPVNVALDQSRNEEFGRVASKTTFHGDGQQLEMMFFWNYIDLHHPIFQYVDQVSNDVGGTLRYLNENKLADHKNIIDAGLRVSTGWIDAKRFVNQSGARGPLTADAEQTAWRIELYGEEQVYLTDHLALVAGAQFSFNDRDYQDRFLADGDNSDERKYYGVSPKVGTRYEFNEHLHLFANISRSYEPPTWGELGTVSGAGIVPLDAQSAWTFEVGSRGREGRLGWDAAFYWALVDKELLSYNVGVGGASLTVNADHTVHRGVELGSDYTLLEGIVDSNPLQIENDGPKVDRLLLRAVYNWNDFRFDSDATFGDNRLPGVPPHVVRAQLLYEHPTGFYIGPNMEFASRSPVDMANDLYADSYAIMGFEVGYRTRKGFSVFFEVRNILDETYASTTGVITRLGAPGVSPAQFLPGDGRTFYVGAEWRF